jgi:hypothetical protein
MAIHKKREHGRPAARLLLESSGPVELPPAEINEAGVTVEREEFRQHLPELFDFLREGGTAAPAPMVRNDSIFVVHGETRTFWVRLWHSDQSRTQIDRLHVTSSLPLARHVSIDVIDDEAEDEAEDDELPGPLQPSAPRRH